MERHAERHHYHSSMLLFAGCLWSETTSNCAIAIERCGRSLHREGFVSTRRGSARVLKRAEPLDGGMALRKLRVEQRRVCEENQSSFGRL